MPMHSLSKTRYFASRTWYLASKARSLAQNIPILKRNTQRSKSKNSKSSGTTQCRLLQEYNLPMFLSPLRGLVGTTIYSAGYASLTHGYILLPLRGIVRVHFPFSLCIFSVEIYSLFCGTTQGRPLQVIKSIIISFTPPGLYIVCSLSGVALRLTPACNLPPLKGFVRVHFPFSFFILLFSVGSYLV